MTYTADKLEKELAVVIIESFAAFDSRSMITNELVKKITRRITMSGKIIFRFTLWNFFIPDCTNNQVSHLVYLTVISSTSVMRSDLGFHTIYSGKPTLHTLI